MEGCTVYVEPRELFFSCKTCGDHIESINNINPAHSTAGSKTCTKCVPIK